MLNESLKEACVCTPLAAQRAYVELSGARTKFGLMVPEAFVRGIRDIGYRSNGDAVAELIDNAIQAYSDRVDVLFGYDGTSSSKKPMQLAVIDNGHGMEPTMIRLAVMWGGTHRENDRSGLGRYGYGLPCSSVSLGRRFTVISRVGGGDLYGVELDLDAITAGAYTDDAGDIVVPRPKRTELPPFLAAHVAKAYPAGWTSGTVILIDKLDRLEWSTAQGLRENLCRQFAVTYHKRRGEAAIFVDNTYVEPIDPLFLTPDFHLHDLDEDRAQAFDPVRVEVRNPESGAYMGAIELRYAWLPPSFGSIDKTRDAMGLNANGRFSILKDYHGLIFSRNGRLIDVQTRTPWTTFINNDRYIKVEVEFSATLDEFFGVTTAKQQVTVSAFIWNLLRHAGLPKAIEQLRIKVKDAKVRRRLDALAPKAGHRRLSEVAMSAARDLGPGQPPPAVGEGDLRITAYTVEFEHAPDRAFFRIERRHGARTMHLNTAHRFYVDLYDGPMTTPEIRSALEVLLFSLSDVILDASEADQSRSQAQVGAWSKRLEAALDIMTSRLRIGDDVDQADPAISDDPT